MANYEWINAGDKKIMYMHLASKSSQELENKIAEFKPVIAQQPPNSLLTIVDVKDGQFSRIITKMIKEFTEHNEPYIKMSVIIGLSGLQKIIYDSVLILTRRQNMKSMNTKEEAIAFLSGL